MFSTPEKHIGKIIRALAALLGVALLIGLFSSNVYAEEPENGLTRSYEMLTDAEFAQEAAELAPEGSLAREGSLMWFGCNYTTEGDYPHKSGRDVSVHGWWKTKDPNCPRYADVEVWLKAWVCLYDGDEKVGCSWETLDQDKERIRQGGGRGKRTSVRHGCADSRRVSYMNVVDVDLVGMWDWPDRKTIRRTVDCYPSD